MIVDEKAEQSQTPKGCHGFTQSNVIPLGLDDGFGNFYNPAIPSGLELRKVSYSLSLNREDAKVAKDSIKKKNKGIPLCTLCPLW